MIFVTGGAGFIGSNFILHWFKNHSEALLNIDALTYAGNLENLKSLNAHPALLFAKVDICQTEALSKLLRQHNPRAILHFAAESHVDRSLHGPQDFLRTNVQGTFSLLQATKAWWDTLKSDAKSSFRFLHVSTDEVYGSLSPQDPPFTEQTPYAPNSPYAASKAASDHLVRAWHHTWGFPTLTTNCSNNYGPFQFPEKLIPLMITHALAGKPLPVYGNGLNTRDWLHVEDHVRALCAVLEKGQPGGVWNIGGWNEKTNLEIVHRLCELLQKHRPKAHGHYSDLIQFVKDRPGHDLRYAINANHIFQDLGWKPLETFDSGIEKTVEWYLSNAEWISNIQNGTYKHWMELNYAKR